MFCLVCVCICTNKTYLLQHRLYVVRTKQKQGKIYIEEVRDREHEDYIYVYVSIYEIWSKETTPKYVCVYVTYRFSFYASIRVRVVIMEFL